MSSRTKIVVLHMKEIIYTAIFAALALLVIVLLIFMFGTGKKDSAVKNEKQYTPGTYTSTLTLNNTNLEVEVSVDAYKINSIRFSNLDETVTTMFHSSSLPSKKLPNKSMKHSHLIQSLCPKIRHIRRNLYWTPFPKPSKKPQ